ncbi:DUF3630 family protein [Cognaticolwellia mytili]|uniref:DUF3630 family protein n=1 Tax=Cognaticolwellia mytili TaxID=1888913 RepID=UPI000A16CEB3|nr:DUF3630 family protein [Cognaticolwellia mytili]
MKNLNLAEIASIESIGTNVLQVKFTLDWSMEDSVGLGEKLVMLASAKVIESVQGADLHCIRLQFKNTELLLNFEEYSHSCWFECASKQDLPGLLALKEAILQNG